MISAIIITFNEERNIRRCLRTLSWVDEIIVVDAWSTDQTVAIAKEFGAKVYSQEWLGYVAQKQFALDRAKGEWVISLDADEELEADLISEMKQALDHLTPEVNGFSMPRKCYYLGKWIYHGEWYPDRKVRLMRRSKSVVGGLQPHDTFIVKGHIQSLHHHILHYSYDGLADHATRMHRYAKLMARNHYDRGQRFSIQEMFGEPLSRAFKNYVLLKGYRDGYRGMLITLMLAYYVFMQSVGLKTLERTQEQDG